MSNLYSVGVKKAPTTIPGSGQTGGPFSSGSNSVYADYYYEIVTDTLQNAMAIARARLAHGETITNVAHTSDQVIVDPSCVAGDPS